MSLPRSARRSLLSVTLLLPGPVSAADRPAVSEAARLEQMLLRKEWDRAGKQIARLEKAEACSASLCAAARAIWRNGEGKADEALDLARQAAAALGPSPALPVWVANELGVLLYRLAADRPRDLELSARALRHAAAGYTRSASNIRFNLATVLAELGQKEESGKLLAAIEAEGGVLIDPGLAILGDYQGPDRQ